MMRTRWLPALLMIVLVGLWGCSDDDDSNPNVPAQDQTGVVTGTVQDAGGMPLAGVQVVVGDKSAASNEQGYFSVEGIPAGDYLAVLTLASHMTVHRAVTVAAGQTSYLTGVVLPVAQQQTVPAGTGGTVTSGPARADLPAGGFVDGQGDPYDGDVIVRSTGMVPEQDGFFDAFPGSFQGVRSDGSTVTIASYGFMDVNLTGADKAQDLQLAPGHPATLSLDMGEKALSLPDTIPMWYFDPADGLWHEEGIAVKNGTRFEAEVTHFTTWNWDVPVDDICSIEGVVTDVEGSPVAGVTVKGESLPLGLLDRTTTDLQGRFSLRALKYSRTTIWAVSGTHMYGPIQVDVEDVCPVVLQDTLTVTRPAFNIILQWGESPSDLDSHLWIPAGWSPEIDWYEIAYYQMGTMGEDPYTQLDTDDISSYGPEIITGARLYEGTYQYWVYNYSNGNTRELHDTSGATVRVEVGNQSRSFAAADVPLEGADPTGWWHVFDMTVGAGGDVTVTPVMRFQERWVPGGKALAMPAKR